MNQPKPIKRSKELVPLSKEHHEGLLFAWKIKQGLQNGIGIEAMLTDSETKRIVDSLFIPSFKNGNYFSGTLNGLEGIISHLNRKLKKGN